MNFNRWIKIGRKNKWISNPTCNTHEGFPMTKEELDAWDEGADPCIHVLRLYSDKTDFDSAEGSND